MLLTVALHGAVALNTTHPLCCCRSRRNRTWGRSRSPRCQACTPSASSPGCLSPASNATPDSFRHARSWKRESRDTQARTYTQTQRCTHTHARTHEHGLQRRVRCFYTQLLPPPRVRFERAALRLRQAAGKDASTGDGGAPESPHENPQAALARLFAKSTDLVRIAERGPGLALGPIRQRRAAKAKPILRQPTFHAGVRPLPCTGFNWDWLHAESNAAVSGSGRALVSLAIHAKPPWKHDQHGHPYPKWNIRRCVPHVDIAWLLPVRGGWRTCWSHHGWYCSWDSHVCVCRCLCLDAAVVVVVCVCARVCGCVTVQWRWCRQMRCIDTPAPPHAVRAKGSNKVGYRTPSHYPVCDHSCLRKLYPTISLAIRNTVREHTHAARNLGCAARLASRCCAWAEQLRCGGVHARPLC